MEFKHPIRRFPQDKDKNDKYRGMLDSDDELDDRQSLYVNVQERAA